MNYRMALSLVAGSTLASSILMMSLMAGLASAAESSVASEQTSCDLPVDSEVNPAIQSILHSDRETLVASSIEIPVEYPTADFSAAESDAAVTLFGCDCPSCISALRQLRSQSLLDNSQGHCWTALQNRVSQDQVQEVLQTLEVDEALENEQ